MRKKGFILAVIVISVFSFLFLLKYAYSEDLQYTAYLAQKSGLNLAVQYPKDWFVIGETEGSSRAYGSLTFHEPGHLDEDVIAANITISAKNNSEFDLNTLKPESLLGRSEMSSFKLISKRVTQLGNFKGLDLIMTYTLFFPSWTGGSVFLPAKARVIILQRDAAYYIFKYEDSEKEFDNFLQVFEYCVNTVKFNELKQGQ